MSDSFTTNLNLTEPEVGASADTWGTKLNADLVALDAMLGAALTGLTLSTAGSSGTFGIAAGGASGMALASAYTKTTSSWAVGSGNGSLDTGAIANATWYHVWLIQRTDTGVVDVLTSLSASSPTMPSNYTRKRRIGAMKTDGSAHWVAFIQIGDDFLWKVALDTTVFNPLTVTGSNQDKVVDAPTGVRVKAFLVGTWQDGPGNPGDSVLSIRTPDEATPSGDVYGAVAVAPAETVGGTGNPQQGFAIERWTDTSAQVRIQGFQLGSFPNLYMRTRGWSDPRGKF